MKNIYFIVYGIPKTLKRHRHTKSGHTYDPNTQDKEAFIAQAIAFKPEVPIKTAIALKLQFYFPRPKSHYNTKNMLKENAPMVKMSKPDLTNLIKLVEDSFNGIFWVDDSQITNIVAMKSYSAAPCTIVEIHYADAN